VGCGGGCEIHTGRHQHNPDAAGGKLTLVAVGGAAKAVVEVPGAAAEHAGVALDAFRICFRAVLVIILVKGVSTGPPKIQQVGLSAGEAKNQEVNFFRLLVNIAWTLL
jgi:hypothetical protein